MKSWPFLISIFVIFVILAFVCSPVLAISKSDLISSYKGQSIPTPTPTPSLEELISQYVPDTQFENWIIDCACENCTSGTPPVWIKGYSPLPIVSPYTPSWATPDTVYSIGLMTSGRPVALNAP